VWTEVGDVMREPPNEEPLNLYTSPNNYSDKLRRIGWAKNVERVVSKGNGYRNITEKSEAYRSL
jgi:hypothetical protein